MKIARAIYPSLVGLLLGLLQTGLFFQLSFTLSSSFRTFLMITVCWLLGSVIGLRFAKQITWPLNLVLLWTLIAYFVCALLLAAAPFQTQIWPIYAGLIVLMGLYPGLFFCASERLLHCSRVIFPREQWLYPGPDQRNTALSCPGSVCAVDDAYPGGLRGDSLRNGFLS